MDVYDLPTQIRETAMNKAQYLINHGYAGGDVFKLALKIAMTEYPDLFRGKEKGPEGPLL